MADSDQLYNDLLSDVNDLIDELGTAYTVYTPGDYDPDLLSTGEETSRSVDGVVTGQPIVFAAPADWTATKTLILKASSAPNELEEVLVDGNRYPLSAIEKIKPADITIAYMLDVSR
jgi:hypothetical protein